MQTFTGYEYLMIDVANHYGLDKDLFENRITWVLKNIDNLLNPDLLEDIKPKKLPGYLKAVQALHDAAAGKSLGHRVGFDAICSGMQIMSALTQCENGCKATGLIDTGIRPNAYTEVGTAMSHHLEGSEIVIHPDDIKQAVMTTLYGSKAVPRRLFGCPHPEDPSTPELLAFYAALKDVAPGAVDLMDSLLSAWNPQAFHHTWALPDTHVSYVPVMVEREKRIRIEELNNSSLTYHWYENSNSDSGLSLVANVTHSIDAYILRSLIRRCTYNRENFIEFRGHIMDELIKRAMNKTESQEPTIEPINCMAKQLKRKFMKTKMVDVLILDFISVVDLSSLTTVHLEELLRVIKQCLVHAPFNIICVHDEFTAHPNNLNYLRDHYRNILADLSQSEILTDIFQQITGSTGQYEKQNTDKDIPSLIRQANYMLS